MGHKIEVPGHTWGKKLFGAKIVGYAWVTVEAKNYFKHSFGKLNTLGPPLGHSWAKKLLGHISDR